MDIVLTLVISVFGLLFLGHYKKDSTTLILAGFFSTYLGLFLVNSYPSTLEFGIIFIFYGLYTSIRSAIELIKGNEREVKYDRRNKGNAKS